MNLARLLPLPLLFAGAWLACGAATSAPLPPSSGDWVLDPSEVVFVNGSALSVEGNITLQAGSELHLEAVQLTFLDAASKRSLTGPAGSVVTVEASTLSAERGPRLGGFGYFIRVDGTLVINASQVTGLSGPTIPNPFGETEGIHLTSSSSRVTNSSISGASGYAITVTVVAGTIAPTIADNSIQGNAGGVFIAGFVILRADAVIERNTFQLNALPHIASTGSNPVIRGNSFLGSSAGITVVLGSPLIVNNTFVGNLLNAVSVSQGGGRIEGNTVTGTAIAFASTGSTVAIANNTVTLSATLLQASASIVTFDDNRMTGAFGPAFTLNGSSLTGRNNVIESSSGTILARATNGSTVSLTGGALSSLGGAGLSAEGGSVTLDTLNLTASSSPLSASDCAVTLQAARITGGQSDPVVSLRRGSLHASGGEASGGGDGFFLDGASSTFNRTLVRGNNGWGIHAVHAQPSLSPDELSAFVNGNAGGDLLYEADLTVVVLNSQAEPVANVSVQISSALGDPPLTGATDAGGRVGPVRLQVRRVDALNNVFASAPYSVRASFAPSFRAMANASLPSDEEVQLTLFENVPPTGAIDAPASALLNELIEARVSAADADGDALVIRWAVDDGRTFDGPVIHLAFDATGLRSLNATVSDGLSTLQLSRVVRIATAAELNVPPLFLSTPDLSGDLANPYTYDVFARDPDSQGPLVFILVEGPEGMVLSQDQPVGVGRLSWTPSTSLSRSADAARFEANVSLAVFDGMAFSYQNFTILVKAPPDQPPRIAPLVDITVARGSFTVVALDPYISDSDDPLGDLSIYARLDNGTGWTVFVNRDASGHAELYLYGSSLAETSALASVNITVTDPAGLSASRFLAVRAEALPQSTGGPGAESWLPSVFAAAAAALAVWALLRTRRHDASP
jgi:hypothetical protein